MHTHQQPSLNPHANGSTNHRYNSCVGSTGPVVCSQHFSSAACGATTMTWQTWSDEARMKASDNCVKCKPWPNQDWRKWQWKQWEDDLEESKARGQVGELLLPAKRAVCGRMMDGPGMGQRARGRQTHCLVEPFLSNNYIGRHANRTLTEPGRMAKRRCSLVVS